jgi:hypothetical protein
MDNLPGLKRGFYFGQGGMSWCTRCNGSKCKKDVGFVRDVSGSVQGYMIDSGKLKEADSKRFTGENRRKNDFPPHDGIHKRTADVEQLLSRSPACVNTIRFSNDLLHLLLIGVEGCDDFVKGERKASSREFPMDRKAFNLNGKAAEVLSGTRRIQGIKVVKRSGRV